MKSASGKPKHPAADAVKLLIILSVLAWTLSLIAIFVPWSWKDTAVYQRTSISLWQNCINTVNDPLKGYTCWDNDIDQVGSIAGGSQKCRGYIAATQVFTVATVCFTFLAVLCAIPLLKRLWSKPIALSLLVALLAFFAFSCCLVAFLMWIVYTQTICQAGNPLFPVDNFSWGWICMVVATLLTFLAMLLAYWAWMRIIRFKPTYGFDTAPAPIVMGPIYPGMAPTATVIVEPIYAETTPMPSPAGMTGYPAMGRGYQ